MDIVAIVFLAIYVIEACWLVLGGGGSPALSLFAHAVFLSHAALQWVNNALRGVIAALETDDRGGWRPSSPSAMVPSQICPCNAWLSEYSRKKESLQENIDKSKIGRQDTAERTALTKELAALRQKKDQLKSEIEKYKECDPDVVEEIRQTNKVAKEAANRWTDNIFSVKSWAKKKFGFEDSKINKTFGIPEDFDYID
ncbi:meiotic nuclear division protein 1 homolog isoform X2 [Paroedura picta]|uniref:meiotic nuclear division protein 1 homolog isoform X2 n=1 Tax=Paroedura picta TaxID=143630 RepID=UPI004056FEDA